MSLWHAWSVRTRLTVISTAVMALVCTAASLFVLSSVRHTAERYMIHELTVTASRVCHMDVRDRPPPLIEADGAAGIQVIDERGRVISASAHLAGRPRMADFQPAGRHPQADRIVCESPAFPGRCMHVVAYQVTRPDGVWTAYAADYQAPWYVDRRLLSALIGLSLVLVLLTAFGAYQTVRKALAPVEAITEKLSRITTNDLQQRVPVPKYRDEIRRLAVAANRTLDRASHAVEQQRRFASDVSHDLRGPITAMRTEVEAALMHPEDADWRATARALLAGLDRLQALVTDLLQLARLDAGARPVTERVDLAELVARELDRRPRKVEVVRDLAHGVVVIGERLSLARLLNNLLDNGERHAVSTLWVSTRREAGKAVLEVLDDGCGIPPDKREVVFQRFMRLDAARRLDAGGTGLGLPIARQIAESHGGTLTIEDSPVGARFVLRLPAAG